MAFTEKDRERLGQPKMRSGKLCRQVRSPLLYAEPLNLDELFISFLCIEFRGRKSHWRVGC